VKLKRGADCTQNDVGMAGRGEYRIFIGANLLAKASSALRLACKHALSLTTIASELAPTVQREELHPELLEQAVQLFAQRLEANARRT
jgi:hypothetical protein